MEQDTTMRLLRYNIENIIFNLNTEFNFGENSNVGFLQNISRLIEKIDDKTFKVSVKYEILEDSNNQECKSPFTISVIVAAVFELNNWESKEFDEIVKINTVAILYPFIRSIVANITSNANIPAFVMPVVNVAALLQEKER